MPTGSGLWHFQCRLVRKFIRSVASSEKEVATAWCISAMVINRIHWCYFWSALMDEYSYLMLFFVRHGQTVKGTACTLSFVRVDGNRNARSPCGLILSQVHNTKY